MEIQKRTLGLNNIVAYYTINESPGYLDNKCSFFLASKHKTVWQTSKDTKTFTALLNC